MASSPTPSDVQLEILDLLWRSGSATVQDVHLALSERRAVAYSTVLTHMQRMAKAGWVKRDTTQRTHRYTAAVAREDVEAKLFSHLAKTAFGGSIFDLALRALGRDEPSPEELDQLQAWIDEQKQQR